MKYVIIYFDKHPANSTKQAAREACRLYEQDPHNYAWATGFNYLLVNRERVEAALLPARAQGDT